MVLAEPKLLLIQLNLKGCKSLLIYTFFIFVLSGCNLSSKNQSEVDVVVKTPVSSVIKAQDKKRFDRWIFNEMYQQLFLQQSANVEQQRGWLNVLGQGASIEGVYHGLILSSDYRAKEVGSTTIQALKYFANEAVLLRADKNEIDPALSVQSDAILAQARAASVFTLKRELGELILSAIDKRKNNKEELARWYAQFAVRSLLQKVDFGIAQRGLLDLEYHRLWAINNDISLIQWESLNRAHRILNQLGQARDEK